MAYKVIILYQLYMPSYFLGTFTEYPYSSAILNIMLILDRNHIYLIQHLIRSSVNYQQWCIRMENHLSGNARVK